MVKIKFLKISSKVLAGLLTLLGFASTCGDPAVEYGMPTAKFIVKGSVTSLNSNEAIQGIRVTLQQDTAWTDKDGKYEVSNRGAFPDDQTFAIQFTDYDGSANGDYQDVDTLVEFKDPEFTNGDDNWYSGETTKEFNIKLNLKK